MRFWTVPLAPNEEIDRLATAIDESPGTRMKRDSAPLLYVPVAGSLDDDDDATLDTLGPGDSQYELTVSDDDENDDSHVELPAFTYPDVPSSDEIEAIADDQSSEEAMIVELRSSDRFERRGGHRFGVTLIAVVLLVAIPGFLVRRGIISTQRVSSSMTALVAGMIGLGGVVLLLFAARRTPFHLVRGELTGRFSRPRPRSNLDSRMARE